MKYTERRLNGSTARGCMARLEERHGGGWVAVAEKHNGLPRTGHDAFGQAIRRARDVQQLQ